MSKTSILLVAAVLAACDAQDPLAAGDAQTASVGETNDFRVISSTETAIDTSAGRFRVMDREVQTGNNPLNRFGVERVYREGASLRGAIVLTPGMNLSAASWKIGDLPGDEGFLTTTVGILARTRLDVYLYTPRPSLLDPAECLDPSTYPTINGWGVQAQVDDVEYIRRLAADEHGGLRPIILGYSLGGDVALAAVNQRPNAWAGLISVDAPFVTSVDAVRDAYAGWCSTWAPALEQGQALDPTHAAELGRQLFEAAVNYPTVQPMGSALTYRQLFLLTLATPSPGPPMSFLPPGVRFAVADPFDGSNGHFVIASEARALAMLGRIANCTAFREMVNVACELGGAGAFTSRLARFKGPALGFQLDLGNGGAVTDSFARLGGPTQVLELEGYAHMDLFASPRHEELFEQPVLQWIADNERLLGW